MVWSRGDLVWASLDPVKKGEQGRTRPCLIVSYDSLNHSKHPCVIICPITGKENVHKTYPTHVFLPKGTSGATKDSVIMAEQIRTIAKERIDLKKKVARIPLNIMKKVETFLKKVLDLNQEVP